MNWDLETGYHKDIYGNYFVPFLKLTITKCNSLDVEVKNKEGGHGTHDLTATEELPRRGIAPGKSMGLSLLLNVNESEYYCSGTKSVGFKVQ